MSDPAALTASAAAVTRRKMRPLHWLLSLLRRRREPRLSSLTPEQLEDYNIPDDLRRAELARRAWDVPPVWYPPSRGLWLFLE